ncbi:MAG: ribonuclease III [Caldisericales bacterium]|jgi:ribonuclease-3|nr:ribonuclease III [Caldisericia bacterium]NMD15081.1 ribonuclease III [Caldisericales bacterium]
MLNLFQKFRLRQDSSLTAQQKALFKRLGLQNSYKQIFLEALTHPSYTSENDSPSYQRLEYLGDAILGGYVAYRLYMRHRDWQEDKLTRARASIVSQPALAKSARKMGISHCLLLGKGERANGGSERDSILCDCFESIVAVVFIAKGFQKTCDFLDVLGIISMATDKEDPKSELQSLSQKEGLGLPHYHIVGSDGPAHCMRFEAKVSVGENIIATAWGNSKQEAEQNAAIEALKKIEK